MKMKASIILLLCLVLIASNVDASKCCGKDGDCPPNCYCRDNECVPRMGGPPGPQGCGVSADCPPSHYCRNNECVPFTPGGPIPDEPGAML